VKTEEERGQGTADHRGELSRGELSLEPPRS